MTFRLLIASLILIVLASARAETPPGKPQQEFRVVAWNRAIPDLFYDVEGEPRALPLRRAVPTRLQHHSGPASLTLYRRVGEARIRQPVATVALRPPPQKSLVVLWLDHRGAWQATVLADEPDRPAPGEVRLVNHTQLDLLIKCSGREPFVLAPAAERIVPAGGKGMGLKIALSTVRGVDWEPVLSNGIPLGADERATVFVADPSALAPVPKPVEEPDRIEFPRLNLFVIRDRTPPR